MPDKKLIVIGDGPDFEKIRAYASTNVTLMGYQSFEVLRDHMQRARAFVFAAEEDFGITPVEAQACGTPVIAFGRGGATETVIDGASGLLFERQNIESLCEAVKRFETMKFDYTKISMHTHKFSEERFLAQMKQFLQEKLEK